MKKVALILSGCGHLDGAEITEGVSLLIGLSQAGAKVSFFAPDMAVPERNHLTREVERGALRNALKEAARLARGEVADLTQLFAKDFDGLAFAGGMGVARNLCDWAEKGSSSVVNPEVRRIIKEFYSLNRPIGAVCIAPVLLGLVLGHEKIEITLGNESDPAATEIRKTGALTVPCPVTDFVTDRAHKVITTPAYMLPAMPHQIFQGIAGLSRELVEMA